jgi:3-oxoacyl-[acyl-carrier protein] reductase
MEVNEQVMVVTGAGSGIGRALALTFAEAGAKVVCCGRRIERLENVVAEIEEAGGTAFELAVDVTNAGQTRRSVETILEKWGQVDVLFNNAGSFNAIGALHEIDPEVWWQDVSVNLRGVMLMMHATLPSMIERDAGVIINMNGGRPTGGSGYAAGKAGVVELSRVVSLELQKMNSKVVILTASPGLVQTEMTELQANSEAGRQWIPSTQESLATGSVRSPFDIAHKTVEVLKQVVPEWSGQNYNATTTLPLDVAK